MTSEDKWSSDEVWDCVADGPLHPTELAELVAACEQRPELWKRCALVLLEEQALRSELQAFARDRHVSGKHVSGLSKAAAAPCLASSQLFKSSVDAQVEVKRMPEQRVESANVWQFWNHLALAASVMIAFGIGWQASKRFGLVGPESGANVGADVASVASVGLDNTQIEHGYRVDGQYDQSSLEESGRLLADIDTLDPAVIDQFNAETLARAMRLDWKENLDPEYQQLRERGYDVESQEGLIPVWLYDGRSAVIPYQQIKVRKSTGRAY